MKFVFAFYPLIFSPCCGDNTKQGARGLKKGLGSSWNTKQGTKTIKPIIKQLVKEGSIVVTDEWQAYRGLAKNYQHVVVNHKEGKYVCGPYSTNRIEGYWSIFKRGVYGIYHQVSAKHLHRYCDEFSFRYNSREADAMERFAASLQTSERRLTYFDLTKGNKETGGG